MIWCAQSEGFILISTCSPFIKELGDGVLVPHLVPAKKVTDLFCYLMDQGHGFQLN